MENRLSQIKNRIDLYSKKYNSTFEEFEQKIKKSAKENFEEWDDYMEWNALQKFFQDIEKSFKNS
ncbi:MAG: hypothetical protein JST55_11540 [Bacteroidetes bacterium]|nr:hypothetical protein [Bacteroidota bacterium]